MAAREVRMRTHSMTRFAFLGAMLVAAVLSGCASSASTGAGTPGAATATASGPTATPTPPPHALAWFQMDASKVGQIWASINGAAAHQITHMTGSGADCARDEHWSPPVFSPDLTKIVASWGSADCTDGAENGPVYIIDASTGTATQVSIGGAGRLSLRELGWINNTTIWSVGGQQVFQYVIGGSATALGTIASGSSFVQDAVLRGSTLFFSVTAGSGTSYTLRRFDMSSHSLIGGSVNLGTTNPCICSKNDALTPGFDVSPDGSHIVFQRVTPAVGTGGDAEGVGGSQFF